jgi:hypothetical protein
MSSNLNRKRPNNAISVNAEIIDLTSDDHEESTAATANTEPPASIVPRSIISSDPGENVIITADLGQQLLHLQSSLLQHCILIKAPTLHHIQQQDDWSCGYRNTQMLLSSCLLLLDKTHAYFKRTSSQTNSIEIPSIRQLQIMFEAAWKAGYDPNGAKYFAYQLVGKRQWIGAVDVACLLGFLGIDATVIQFVKCDASRKELGPFCKAYFELQTKLQWCWKCCPDVSSRLLAQEALRQAENGPSTDSNFDKTCSCPMLPLFCQWKGHSVTVVGVEYDTQNAVTNLILFDPKRCGAQLRKGLQKSDLSLLRKPCRDLWLNQDVQVVLCSGKTMTAKDQDVVKRVENVLTAKAWVKAQLMVSSNK